MQNESLIPRGLVGVYPSAETARRMADRLQGLGVDPAMIRVDSEKDVTTSLTAEMQEEVTESFVSPQVGVVYTKETVKAQMAFGPPLIVGCTVVTAAVSAFITIGDLGVWGRLLIGAVCGAALGGTLMVLIVPALSVKNPQELSAADRGVTVRVGAFSPEIESAMVEAEPLRLDRLWDHDTPIGTVTTEEDTTDGGIIEEVAENFARDQRAEPEDRTR